MKQLYFIRHGQSQMNAQGLYAGRIETPLTLDGISQVESAANAMKLSSFHVDLIACSTYARARDTAIIIARAIDYPLDKIVFDDLLVERSFGAMEGKSEREYRKEHDFSEMDLVEGAETIEKLDDRAKRALDKYSEVSGDAVLIVSHGSFGRALRRVVNGLPHSEEYTSKSWIENAELIQLI